MHLSNTVVLVGVPPNIKILLDGQAMAWLTEDDIRLPLIAIYETSLFVYQKMYAAWKIINSRLIRGSSVFSRVKGDGRLFACRQLTFSWPPDPFNFQ